MAIEVDAAGIGLDDVGQPQCQGQGGQEGFPAGEGIGRPGIARIIVIDFDVEADLLDPFIVPALGALQGVALTAHGLEPFIGRC